nr:hypothetical protein [Bacteroidales bacterium]
WQPTPEKKAIINLPSTVQVAMPHVFADQIEYMSDNMKYREGVVPRHQRLFNVLSIDFFNAARLSRTVVLTNVFVW